jgi:hypothetical protein
VIETLNVLLRDRVVQEMVCRPGDLPGRLNVKKPGETSDELSLADGLQKRKPIQTTSPHDNAYRHVYACRAIPRNENIEIEHMNVSDVVVLNDAPSAVADTEFDRLLAPVL